MLIHSTPCCGAWVGHRHLQVHHPLHAWAWGKTHFSTSSCTLRVGFCSPSPKFWFDVCISSFLASNLLACIFVFSDWNFWLVLIFLFSRPMCAEFKMTARFVSLKQTCLQPLWRRSSSLCMMLTLPIFWRKHHPHLLVASALSTT